MQGSCQNPGKDQVWSIYTSAPRPQVRLSTHIQLSTLLKHTFLNEGPGIDLTSVIPHLLFLVHVQAMYNWSTSKGYETIPLFSLCAGAGADARTQLVNCFGFPCTSTSVCACMEFETEEGNCLGAFPTVATFPHRHTRTHMHTTDGSCTHIMHSSNWALACPLPLPTFTPGQCFLRSRTLRANGSSSLPAVALSARMWMVSPFLQTRPSSTKQANATPTTARCCLSGGLTMGAAPRASAWASRNRCRRRSRRGSRRSRPRRRAENSFALFPPKKSFLPGLCEGFLSLG